MDEGILEFEEVAQMKAKKIRAKFTSTEEMDFESVLGQMIINHSEEQ